MKYCHEVIKRLLRIPAFRALLLSTALWLITFGLLKERLWREPRSGFFEDATVYDLGYSAVRQTEARAWASVQGTEVTAPPVSTAHKPVMCAALATYNRPGIQYLNETVGSMLAGLTVDERNALNVRILFAHSDPSDHPDWGRKWLEAVDSWSGYNVTESDFEEAKAAEKERNFYVKGVLDYTHVIRDCLERTNAPYIAIFEDDVIFAEGWLSKTIAALQKLAIVHTRPTWLYLRLFYTETSLGWESDDDFWYRNMHLTFLVAICTTLLALLGARRYSARLGAVLDHATIAVLVLIAAPSFVQLVFMAGKYTILPLTGVVRMDKHGCCTQALVFPRARAQDLLEAFSGRNGQTDSMIEQFADERNLARYALAPQVVQHVGLVSSRGNDFVNTRSTWAFWFEAQNAQTLRLEHSKLAGSLEWRSLFPER